MTFDGSTTMMESGVHNGLVRTLSAWIDPYASGDAGGYYQPILDSNDELNAGMYGSGFGLSNSVIIVRLDGLGMWNTGVSVQLNTWQEITLTFNGSTAKLYVNGILKASTAYTADPDNLAGKNYRIGWGQSGSDTSTRTFFDGQILDLQIYDRVTPIADPNVYCWDTQTTAGHQGGNGTWDSTGTNVDWSDGDGTTLTAWPAGSTDKTAAFATDSGNASWNISVTGNPTPLAIDFGDENGYSTDQYTLSGGTLGVGTGGVTAYYSGTISAPVTLRDAQTWDAETGETLTVGGNVNTSGYSLAFSGNGTTYVSGNISGNGSLTQQGGERHVSRRNRHHHRRRRPERHWIAYAPGIGQCSRPGVDQPGNARCRQWHDHHRFGHLHQHSHRQRHHAGRQERHVHHARRERGTR